MIQTRIMCAVLLDTKVCTLASRPATAPGIARFSMSSPACTEFEHAHRTTLLSVYRALKFERASWRTVTK